MALHEVEVSEGIVYLEYEVHILRETLEFILQRMDISDLQGLDESKLKRNAAKYIKHKYPDQDLKIGDWID